VNERGKRSRDPTTCLVAIVAVVVAPVIAVSPVSLVHLSLHLAPATHSLSGHGSRAATMSAPSGDQGSDNSPSGGQQQLSDADKVTSSTL
jgi:hypothetical protein